MHRMLTVGLLAGMLLSTAALPAYAEFTREDAYATSPEAVEEAFSQAAAAIDHARYKDAIGILDGLLAARPNHADALNLMGYSYRKLGNYDEAFRYYHLALENNPLHRGANEYIGEAYLEKGDVVHAREHLALLKKACQLGCKEFDKLQKAIDDYVEKNGS